MVVDSVINTTRGRSPYRNASHTVSAFKILESLRKDEVLCDIKLETNDGTTLYGHKVVLASASPYFHTMFTSFEETNKGCVVMQELDSTALKLLVDFMYTAQIMITEDNVQDLFSASSFLQLDDVHDACSDFLQTRLHSTNCLGIKAFADLHSCTKLSSISETYIQQHFVDVVGGDEFLSLSPEQIINFIASDKLNVPSEEIVFECVISWINHNSGHRKDILPKLMEHVRLPLTPKEYLLKRVKEEPLLRNCLKCQNYIIEALHFHQIKSDQLDTIPQTKRFKFRQPVGKIILVVGGLARDEIHSVEWYDPTTSQWQCRNGIKKLHHMAGFVLTKDCCFFAVGGQDTRSYSVNTVDMCDLTSPSPCWVPTVAMSTCRTYLGVAELDNHIYAVGGYDHTSCLSSAEVFDRSTQKWQKISNMSTNRVGVGIIVFNNLLYAIGGFNGNRWLKSVECYHPSTDSWTSVPELCIPRCGAGVGMLDGVMYAVGGYDGSKILNSVETYRPSTGVWTLVSDIIIPRRDCGVIGFDGLLYVVGGDDGATNVTSVEIYNPNTNTWSMLTAPMNIGRSFAGIFIINKEPYFNT